MAKLSTSDLFDEPPDALSSIDAIRQATWLHRPYSAPVWIVSDSHDAERREKIDFRYRLADGRCLTEVDRLYHTVKSYAFWVRDARYGRIDDAQTHGTTVRNLMNITHSVTRRGLWSFSHLDAYDIDQIIEECRYGADALLGASERVEVYIDRLSRSGAPYGGLPRLQNPNKKSPEKAVAVGELVAACNLPESAGKQPRVAWHIAKASVRNGLRPIRAPAAEIPELANITSQALWRYLSPIESLWTMRRVIGPESLHFKPFAKGAAKVAAQKGVGVARTPIAPPRLALHLMEHATRWVVDYSEPLLEALAEAQGIGGTDDDRRRLYSAILSKLPQSGLEGSPWPIASVAQQGTDALGFVRAIQYLATACWIVIATFTARRYKEILELEDGCLRGDDEAGWWLNIYIEKTLQEKSDIPIPNAVVRAIEVLRTLSKEACDQTERRFLFQWRNPFGRNDHGRLQAFDPRRHLNDFAARVRVPLPKPKGNKSAEPWHWSPHQFRRFYAVLAFYRYEGIVTLEALSHHLRHFNLEMTRRYVTTDKEVAALWTDVEWGFMGHVARGVVSGERSVGGGMGTHLKNSAKRIVDIMRRKMRVVSPEPERVGASMVHLMQRVGLVLTPKPWVVCSCPRTNAAARRAACRAGHEVSNEDVGPNFPGAGPGVCPGCPYSITDKGREGFIVNEINHLQRVEASEVRGATLFGALERERLISLEAFAARDYAGATPMDRSISAPAEEA